MPVIVMASPKGGVGKSTCAVILATEFARMGADVHLFDCDPNKSATRWANHETPEHITVHSDVSASDIVKRIKAADGDGRLVVVDLEGIASQLVSRAIGQADLVIVPMSPTGLDAEIGAEALRLVIEEEEAFGRPIPYAVALTRTSTIPTRVHRQLVKSLTEANVPVLHPPLVQRPAFAELFSHGGNLSSLEARQLDTTGNVHKAIQNAELFAQAVLTQLTAQEAAA